MTTSPTALADTKNTAAIVTAPAASSWVSANAGSGKTYVLTERVTRLLLGAPEHGIPGTEPWRIVCLTFTRAAAAEMQQRLFSKLGGWAMLDDDRLRDQLRAYGIDATADACARARTLFARALDTPGGLRIQTIHSLCETILRRFPHEAGVLPGFRSLDDVEALALQREAFFELLDDAFTKHTADAPQFAADFRYCLAQMPDAEELHARIVSGLSEAANTAKVLEALGSDDGFASFFARLLGLDSGADATYTYTRFREGLNERFLKDLDRVQRELDGKYAERAAWAKSVLEANAFTPTLFAAARKAWLTAGDQPLAKMSNETVRKLVSNIDENSKRIAGDIITTLGALNTRNVYQFSLSMSRMAVALGKAYAERKLRLNALDYQDLIDRTRALLSSVDGAWASYRLDQMTDHLLVDEAQDTSPAQWEIVDGLAAGMLESQGGRARSVFVVGDRKQSIYSFQGADVGVFDRQKAAYCDGRRGLGAHALYTSFRSSPAILNFVDAVFTGDAAVGVADDAPMRHVAHHGDRYGRVELWDLPTPAKKASAAPWYAPVDAAAPSSLSRQLGTQISTFIADTVSSGVILPSTSRPARYADFLVLCQKRRGMFREVIMSLSRHGIPNGGADKIELLNDIAVCDLRSLLRFAVDPNDDLSLAEILRSPLIDLDEAALYDLAAGERKPSLWAELLQRAETDARFRDVEIYLRPILTAGRQHGPYALFAEALEGGESPGWRRFAARLGTGSDDAIAEVLAEALAFESRAAPTLMGFLAHLDELRTEIKRSPGGEADLVRIMTVHGAKGLEAPIVILADAHTAANDRSDIVRMVDPRDEDARPIPGMFAHVLHGKKAAYTAALKRFVEHGRANEAAEYRRRFYVAATRAADILIIAGASAKLKPSSWYGLAQQAFDGPLAGDVKTVANRPGVRFFEAGTPPVATAAPVEVLPTDEESSVTAWPALRVAMVAPRPLTPSAIEAETATALPPRLRLGTALSPRVRGQILHRAFELLSGQPAAMRDELIRLLLVKAQALHDDQLVRALTAEASRVLDDPTFSAIFGPDAMAEVALVGRLDGRPVSAQVDRLLVTQAEVLVVDFKTHRPPPAAMAAVPAEILAQMRIYRALLRQLYPARRVRAAIVWTHVPRLMMVPDDA